MQGLVVTFFFLSLVSLCSCNSVLDYGAVGDGRTDDSQAFLKAWNAACRSTGTLVVPAGRTFMLNPLTFSGPCKLTSVNFKLGGNIVAPKSTGAWIRKDRSRWITFTNINRLVFNGGGQIDGQGFVWWKTCKVDGCTRPKALTFNNCPDLVLSGTRHLNSAKSHISIDKCNRATISYLTISAPGNSPNTDGIDVSDSSFVKIWNSNIGTGDDCIAINRGTSNINITGINCGPGHGISIGSLGENGAYETVENVRVSYSRFSGTTNGLRIKTFQNGSGYVKNVRFEHINVTNTKNPIIITQNYREDLGQGSGGVAIIGVTYLDVRGTSGTQVAITFDCSPNKGCNNILMDTVNLKSPYTTCSAFCRNAKGRAKSVSPVVPCLNMLQ